MKHRTAPTLEVTGRARVTLLGEGRRVEPRSAVATAGLVHLVLDEPVVPGAPVMVEWQDTDVLGETRSCQRAGQAYAVTVSIEHALIGTVELARLARKLLEAS